MKVITYTLVILLFGLSLTAQSGIDSLAADIEEITILGNRLEIPFSEDSRSINVIRNQEILNLNPTNINELLQTVSGLDLRQRGVGGVQADLSIRGGTFEQSLVLVDGVRLSDPQTGHHLMNLPLDVQDIERVEIIKGPAARIFGQNAFAGAVNIITRLPETFGVTAGLEYGEHNMTNVRTSISLPINGYKQKLSAAYRASDGYRYNSDYSIANILYQSELNLENAKFELKAGHVDRDFGANGFYGNETFIDQYETVQTTFVSLQEKSQYGKLKVSPRVSYRRNVDNWQFNRQDPEFFQNFHTTEVWTAELHNSYSHKLGDLGFGVDYSYQHLDSSNLQDSTGVGVHTRNQLGLHLENRFLLAQERLDLTVGLMLLQVTDYDLATYPGIDLGYALTNSLKAFSSVGWTTRIPTYTDLYYKDRGNEGNPNLTEETAFTYELGLKYNLPRLETSLSYFSRKATDQIDWYRASEEEKWTPDNFNEATYQGFDFTLKRSFSSESFLSSINIGYTYLNAEFEETDFELSRNQLENLRHQFILQPHFSCGPLSLNLLLKYNDRVSLEDYIVVNANLNYAYKEHSIFLRASNLLDETYRETNLVEMPGRWVSGGVIMKLK